MVANILDRPLEIYSSNPNLPVLNVECIDSGNDNHSLLCAYITLPGREHYDYCMNLSQNVNIESCTLEATVGTTVSQSSHSDHIEQSLHDPQENVEPYSYNSDIGHSSSDEQSTDAENLSQDDSVNRGRKRKREQEWKCNIRKQKRNAGKEYEKRDGTLRRARTMKVWCGLICRSTMSLLHDCRKNI